MYQNIGHGDELGLGNVGNFSTNDYWSSTEYNGDYAWGQGLQDGQADSSKDDDYYVRAVRAF